MSGQARDVPSYRAGGTKDHAGRNDISKWQKLSGIPEGQVRCAHVLSDVTLSAWKNGESKWWQVRWK